MKVGHTEHAHHFFFQPKLPWSALVEFFNSSVPIAQSLQRPLMTMIENYFHHCDIGSMLVLQSFPTVGNFVHDRQAAH